MSSERKSSDPKAEDIGESLSRMASMTVSSGMKFFNRVVQQAEVALGTTEATPIDDATQTLLARAEVFKNGIETIINQIESYLEPDPLKKGATKLIAAVNTSLVKAPEHVSPSSQLGSGMLTFAQKLPSNSTIWQTLSVCGDIFKEIGLVDYELASEVESRVLHHLREFVHEYRIISRTKDDLMNTRLDLDSLVSRSKRGTEDATMIAESRRLQSDFEMIKARLQDLLEEYCGSKGQAKLSTYLYTFTEIMSNYHAKCAKINSSLRKS